ncbi:MAG: SDR family NAD(P)-dependent oxidoreductase [bacterium]
MNDAKHILITGATDGIGLETARALLVLGHHVLIHGRDPAKLSRVLSELESERHPGSLDSYLADLSDLGEVESLAIEIAARNQHLDVVINNAGVLKSPVTSTGDGLDVRYAVNTIAPYLMTRRLLPLMDPSGRVINLSSAAQQPVDPDVLTGHVRAHDDMTAYAQSKLAITQWSSALAEELGTQGPAVVAVNPGSLLATKMVTDGFGVAGNDVGIGVDILVRAALSEEFASASGKYFDNDSRQFRSPHSDALDPEKNTVLMRTLDDLLRKRG